MKILVLGDVVGELTLPFLRDRLWEQRRALGADLVIANGENVCDIHGISPRAAETLFAAGVDFITTGNHVFDRRDVQVFLNDSHSVIRPCNYPAVCPGEGSRVITAADGWRVLVVNVSGSVFMDALGDPFRAVENELERARRTYDVAVLDIHAEATSEKLALARHFDGRFAVIFGTHTHVPTADEQILPNGTGYITDVGMTGPIHSILGVNPTDVIEKMRTHMPRRFTVATGEIAAQGALFDIDPVVGKCTSVRRIKF
ncbi:MAG: YmdB family metallophosphoesterase [Ruminococcaceae bacterium]|nr:YmdB family metallophosphoesterase [Oscillospiraceae bacterium]